MIRNSLLVALFAVLLSLMLNLSGILVLFKAQDRQADQAPPEPADSAAFEDFAEEALQPEEPEPTPEVEPLEVIEPDASTDIQVASDDPQETLAPDSGTETETLGRVEPTEDVTGAAPPTQGTDAPPPEGTPEAPTETAAIEADEVVETIESEAVETAEEALEDTPEIEAVDDGEILAAAVTRSLRPPSARPSEETFGAEEGEPESNEQPGQETADVTQRSGLDILADAGSIALYGRASLEQARATGNSTQTNYAGQVFQKLNRSLRVHKNEKGRAQVRFQILPNGQVGWIRILKSSGSPNINIAAQANVRNAGPFPRPPNGKPFELTVWFQSQ